MITKPSLEAKQPVGNGVHAPQYQDGTTIISTQSADTTNSSTDLNQSYDQTNRSAQFKNPRKTQDQGAGQGQYE